MKDRKLKMEHYEHMKQEKILLVLLPFWTPLIPPMGPACLKNFLQPHGYRVKAIDANTQLQFRRLYDNYSTRLQDYIPEEKRGNFYNILHDVLQNHMMAHLNDKNKTGNVKLVQELVFKNYFCKIDSQGVYSLNHIIEEFYDTLESYFLQVLEKEKPGIVGVSVYRNTLPASLFALRLTRRKYPRIKTIMGGGIFSQELALGSKNLQYFLKQTPFIDYIIIGEGENLFLSFLQGKLRPGQKVYSLVDIDNRRFNLDTAGLPDFSDFDPGKYINMAAYTSRSCPFQCSFCAESIYWGEYRKKKAPQVVKELAELSRYHRRQLFLMCDSLVNPVIKELAEELIKNGGSIYWDGYLRIDKQVCNLENTLSWRRGGFYRARLGVESGSPKVLAAMGKKITLAQIKEALYSLAQAGIKTTTYWIVGYPGETEEDFRQTLALLEALKDDIYEAECNPFRYFEDGQVNSGHWAKNIKKVPLYPEDKQRLLMLQTWSLDCEPNREKTVERMNRFTQLCQRMGIPNPYSIQEIYEADTRWKKLHQNAVPSLLELNSSKVTPVDTGNIKKLLELQNKLGEEIGDFSF